MSILQRWFSEIDHHQDRYARGLDAHVPSGCSWLDLGAGTKLHDGSSTAAQAALASRANRLVGCDLEIGHLHRNPFLTHALGARGEQLPFAGSSFDVVSANMVLEHLRSPAEVFGEVRRVLTPSGRFIFVTPNCRNPIIWGASALLSSKNRTRLEVAVEGRAEEHVFPTHYRANTVDDITRLADQAGFSVMEMAVFNSIPFFPATSVVWKIEVAWIKMLRTLAPALTTNIFCVLQARSAQASRPSG